jgi:hypothetical protein
MIFEKDSSAVCQQKSTRNRKDSTFTLTYDRDKVADNALELNYWNLNRVINVSSLSPPA